MTLFCSTYIQTYSATKMDTYCQMSMISLGAHSLFSFSTMAKPPTVNSSPPQLTRLTELLSWGNSVKGDHLQKGAPSYTSMFFGFFLRFNLLVLKSLNKSSLTFCFQKGYKAVVQNLGFGPDKQTT